MLTRAAALGLALAVAACTSNPSASRPRHFRRLAERTTAAGLHYLLYTPLGYEVAGPWPTILFLHGDGERGSDLGLVKQEGLPRCLEGREHFPFVVASPQLPRGGAAGGRRHRSSASSTSWPPPSASTWTVSKPPA